MTSTPVTTRRAARAKLRALGIVVPSPFTIDDFCSQLSTARGRPIRVISVDLPSRAASCGAWLATPNADYVCVDSIAPAPLREHIVLHELSHIICDHGGIPMAERVTQYGLLDPSTVRRMLERTLYDSSEEREAELLASEIGSRINLGQPWRLPADDGTRQIIDGLALVMGGGS
ncbi:hypothetical protein ACFWDZ_08285 [Micromonospora aurantiaca]|uniref:IrrE N-terminal-like domain-containing protein n=1 Tax=Micromonospora aurantiaca (nom. illeg.) TaxID=47850 RepID=A0A6N3K5B0_9ACTN|nr:hypothetical protein [Micromonospora aurantiaca]AXH93568.1 hypothetical protein DVH21_28630 [Micromonospora aurantiaca]